MSPDESPVEDAYDDMARTYERHEDDPYCADFEFPATTDLVPDVDGRRVLDAGCGGGRYTEWLVERGADAVAVDVSHEMVERTRRRTDGEAEVRRSDLGGSLDAEAGTFDGVVSGLALHYVEDWEHTLGEFARVLRPGGFLVFSTHDPVDDYVAFDAENYFETERLRMTWSTPDGAVEIPFYRRPFAGVVGPLLDAGFRLEELIEPRPEATFAERKPESYEKRRRYPTFLCVSARLER
ncbi:class I SAM-dependent methyltransferase [Halobacteriales archaeon SW_12_71_31]|nr:MAG: class I SAM-dependent methyltransferase [Halobacteriales archaeon SW_12_71_31]